MKRLSFAIGLLFLVTQNAFSQRPLPPNIQSLAGLPGVWVGFPSGVGFPKGKYPEQLERDGLTSLQIITEAELRLRKAGIRILDADEAPGVLAIHIHAVKSDGGIYAISIVLSFEQSVVTKREPSVETICATWEVNNLLVVEKSNLRHVKDVIGDGMDVFANDFLTANPARR